MLTVLLLLIYANNEGNATCQATNGILLKAFSDNDTLQTTLTSRNVFYVDKKIFSNTFVQYAKIILHPVQALFDVKIYAIVLYKGSYSLSNDSFYYVLTFKSPIF